MITAILSVHVCLLISSMGVACGKASMKDLLDIEEQELYARHDDIDLEDDKIREEIDTMVPELQIKRAFPLVKFPSIKSCCSDAETVVNLQSSISGNGVAKIVPGITVIDYPTQQTGVDFNCSRMALLKINFETLSDSCNVCLTAPMVGRRMLKIVLRLSSGERAGWGFNLGDSISNDGYKGDYVDQFSDAETQGTFNNIVTWSSDLCNDDGPSILKTFPDAMAATVNEVTLYVSNEHIRVVNDNGFNDYICHRCLYALNSQPDAGGVNNDLYLALNRVVTGRSDRRGYGVCSASLSWQCS